MNRVPVLLAMDPDHPRDALQPEPVVEALTRELNLPLYEAAEARWEAYATEEPAEVDPQVTRFVLVLATASQAGTRLAYQRIKQLPRAESRRVGVLLSGAKEPELARRCQGRLAEGALWFLDLSLMEFGHIPAPGPEFNIAVAQMAGKVHEIWTQDTQNKG